VGHPTPDFSNSAGPTAWDTTTHAGHDDYPTASDLDAGGLLDAGVTTWLRANFVPLGAIPAGLDAYLAGVTPGVTQYVYSVTVDPVSTSSGAGFGDVYVNNTGLPISGSVDFPDFLSPVNGGDLRITSTLTLAGSSTVFSGFQVQSNDPVEFYAVPEPASMSLLLVGLVGGAGAYWRRRRSA
jgi:hypothetical protein